MGYTNTEMFSVKKTVVKFSTLQASQSIATNHHSGKATPADLWPLFIKSSCTLALAQGLWFADPCPKKKQKVCEVNLHFLG